MAGVIGKTGSFATVERTPNYLGNALQTVEDNGFKYREEQRLKDAAKKAEEDAKLKEIEAMDQTFKATLTGNKSLDDLSVPYAYGVKQQYADLQRQYDQAKTYEEKADIKTKQGRIKQSFDTFSQVPKMLIAKRDEILEGIKSGKYNQRSLDEVNNLLKAVETGKGKVYLDEYSNPVADFYDVDENGNVKNVLVKGQSVANIIESLNPKLAFNYETYKDTALKNVKPEEYGSQVGANVVKGKRVSEANKTQAKTYAEVILNDPNKLYEAEHLFKEKDPEKLRAILENDFITSIPEAGNRVQSLDSGMVSAQTGARKEARDAKKEEVQRGTGDYDWQSGRDDKNNTTVDPKNVYKKTVTVTNVKFTNLGGVNSDINDGEIHAFALQKNGTIMVSGEGIDSKNVKFKTSDGSTISPYDVDIEEVAAKDPKVKAQLDSYTASNKYTKFTRTVSGNDLSRLVLKAGYDSVEELKQELRDKNREEAKQDKSAPKKETTTHKAKTNAKSR